MQGIKLKLLVWDPPDKEKNPRFVDIDHSHMFLYRPASGREYSMELWEDIFTHELLGRWR